MGGGGTRLAGFKIPIWADANSTLYINNKAVAMVEDFVIDQGDVKLVMQEIERLGLKSKTSIIGQKDKVVNIKIKPLSAQEREYLSEHFNECEAKGIIARITGKTTIDILSANNNKVHLLDKLNADNRILYIGDEIGSGNDSQIASNCTTSVEVKDVKETLVVCKLIKENEDDLRLNNQCRQAVKI